nr:hypothetical protein [Tanacetum cinerariifolium]
MKGIRENEYAIKSEVVKWLKIDADLFTYETPLGMVINEFKRLSSIKNDLLTYELAIVEDFYFPCGEQQLDNSRNGDLDVYEQKVCYDESNQEWFDEREPKRDNVDDIKDLDDYLVHNEAAFIVSEEEERLKER